MIKELIDCKKRDLTLIAGHGATLFFIITIIMQLLLAMGILPITMAWGGAQTVLTPKLQIASILSSIILVFFAIIIRKRAGISGIAASSRMNHFLSWGISLFFMLNTMGNLISSSILERVVFGPISIILALTCLIVSLSRTE